MVPKRFWLPAAMLVFGVVFTGCSDQQGNQQEAPDTPDTTGQAATTRVATVPTTTAQKSRESDRLTSQKELVRFYDAEGAGDHCEVKTRPLFHQRAFDWLDETLTAQAS